MRNMCEVAFETQAWLDAVVGDELHQVNWSNKTSEFDSQAVRRQKAALNHFQIW